MGELLMEESGSAEAIGALWSVEKRFRVTEVFLAVLWVWISLSMLEVLQDVGPVLDWISADSGKCCASAYLSWVFTDCLMSRW
jgi:hypothetical protein